MSMPDAEYRKSRKGFLIGLLLIAVGVAMFFLLGHTEVRYELRGLEEVRGRVLTAESYKPGRRSSWHLRVSLQTDSGILRLDQQAAGHYSHRLVPGQAVRAWIVPSAPGEPASEWRTVWQIEQEGRVVMPVMEVGDRVLNDLIWNGAMALVPLLTGLFLVGRHLVRYHEEDESPRQEGERA